MTIRTHARFFVFGVPEIDSKKPSQLWSQITIIEEESGPEVPDVTLDVYPLHKGPSGKPRFLVRSILSGCAGSLGITYEAREWNPEDYGNADEIIDLKGSLGLDDKLTDFPQVGQLQTQGATIDLPYCWFSAIDTWDNPSLCAVDRYDLSGEDIQFVSRRYNRPDLLPVARAIEYARKRDYGGVRGYCATASVAHHLVSSLPLYIFADELQVTRHRSGIERISFGEDAFQFTVRQFGDRWLIVGFNEN